MTTATRLVGDPRLKCLSVTGALAVAVSVVATGLLAGALLGAATASAQEPARTIIVTDKGTQSIGAFSTKPSGNRPWATLAQAIRAFGAPSSVQHRFGRTGCRVRWASLGLRIEFANYGGRPACSPRYGYAQTAAVGGPGAAGWVTDRGLAIGAPVDQLIALYPGATHGGGGTWWLVTGFSLIGDCDEPPPGCEYPILTASAHSGFVEKFEMVIGAAGE